MQGDSFSSLPVTEGGIIGDRGWAVRDTGAAVSLN
jgi:hypothetical protein